MTSEPGWDRRAPLAARGALACAVALLAVVPSAVTAQVTDGPRAAPEPVVASAEEFYELEGETIDGVIRALNAMRLEGEGGPLAQGLTRYRILPEWRPAGSGGTCRVAALRVDVRIRITLPEWPAAARVDEATRLRWERIFASIRDHEYAHRDLTIAAARDLSATLAALEARGCTALRRAVSGSLSDADTRLGEAHAELDRATPDRLIG